MSNEMAGAVWHRTVRHSFAIEIAIRRRRRHRAPAKIVGACEKRRGSESEATRLKDKAQEKEGEKEQQE